MAYCLKISKSPQKLKDLFTEAEGLPSSNIRALSMDSKGKTYIGTDAGLCYFDGKKIVETEIKDSISMLYADENAGTWAGTESKLHYIKNAKLAFSQDIDSEAIGIDAKKGGETWLATKEYAYKLEGKAFVRFSRIEYGGAVAMAAFGEKYVITAVKDHLQTLHGKRPRWSAINPSNSQMPTWQVNALASDEYGHLWVGTDKGLCIYDGLREWRTYDDVEAFPKTEITKILLGKNGTMYIGTKIGLYILDGVKKSFLSANRWLADEEVTAIAASDDGKEYWVGTKLGLSRITIKDMSLAEKADYYQKNIEKYNVREGYVMHRQLSDKEDIESGEVYVSDNDGLWTATFMASQCFKYGATKDPEALKLAKRSKEALFRLMNITGVEGFFARSYRRPGQHQFGNGDPEWFPTEDENGPLEWKCETSSDETSGHFFGLALYYDICADKKEKEEIKTALCKIMDYILKNNYNLHDVDGKPTTWARWGPSSLNLDDKWLWEKGVNSLEFLSFLKTCYHMSGDQKYQDEYLNLIKNHHYAMNAMQHKIHDNHVSHIDDHLGFIVTPALLRYEDDKTLRQMYLIGLNHHWQNQRVERCPYWNIFYGAMTGERCDIENSVKSLEEIPLNLHSLPVKNSKRPELIWDEGQEIYGGGPQLVEPLPYDEKNLHNYDGNPFRPDGGDGGRYWDASNIFLVPYWAARYYGLIEEEK